MTNLTNAAASDVDRRDRLFRLLPQVLQMSDVCGGGALQALLRIMTEQADVVEDDIAALLDNWFIETCDDWTIPYIAELVGYKSVFDASQFGDVQTARDHERVRVLAPRREAANTLRYRRRKGTLLVLEEIAHAASGWPARAVECRGNIGAAWHAGFPQRVAGRTLNLHAVRDVARAEGPFDVSWRRTDLRRLASTQTPGLGNPFGILLWAWRLKHYGVRQGEAFVHCSDDVYRRYTFDPFGLDGPLFTLPQRLPYPTQPAGELQVPAPIGRFAFRAHPSDYYGKGRSIYLWRGQSTWGIPVTQIVPADLSHWRCPLQTGQIALDPERGRILCRWDDDERAALLRAHGGQASDLDDDDEPDLWVRYHSGFSADIGGGSYRRILKPPPAPAQHWHIVRNLCADGATIFVELSDALEKWKDLPRPRRVVMEIEDDGTYGLGLHDRHKRRTMHLHVDDELEIRAAPGSRPALVPGEPGCGYEWRFGHKDDKDQPGHGGRVVLNGLRIADLTVVLAESAADVCLSHLTLTPGRTDLRLQNFAGKLSIERSIVGAIESQHVHDGTLAPRVRVADSIIDGVGKPALSVAGTPEQKAYVRLRAERTTLFARRCAFTKSSSLPTPFSPTIWKPCWESVA